MEKVDNISTLKKNRTICLPFTQENYEKNVEDPARFRKCLDDRMKRYPELFPHEMLNGYLMKDIYYSKKLFIMIRRVKIKGVPHTIRPSFVMPYMTGIVDDTEKILFLRKFDVPFWALSYVFGKDPMHWHRIEQSIGRNSIVGTTVRNSYDIPRNLGADEKHTRISGKKTYVATTVGDECILGVSVSENAGEESLRDAYNVFKQEAQCVNPDYTPDTINTDGWKATQNALSYLFPFAVIICCFLHVFIKIRDRARKKHQDIFHEAASRLWDCYHAESKASFSQRIRRLIEWCQKKKAPAVIFNPIKKLRENIDKYKVAYDFPKAHRTSNMTDRLMQRMDRHLFSCQYFHGSMLSAELSIRGWALIKNFAPYNPGTIKKLNGLQSPAERLNKFKYHDNWLHNLLISASLGGYRSPPQNPL